MEDNRHGHTGSTATQETRLAIALRYAEAGFAVFPVWHVRPDGTCACGKQTSGLCTSPGKHPIPLNGVKAATTDKAQIVEWWAGVWSHANIGLATGSISGIWVLDVDGEKGKASLEALTEEHGPLPDTLVSETGSGGYHYFFELGDLDVGNSAGKLAPGLDVRSDGGYVIVPPSSHVSGGSYRWVRRTEPVEAPSWLSDRVVRPERLEQALTALTAPSGDSVGSGVSGGRQAYVRAAVDNECAAVLSAPEGARNDTLNRASFALGQLVGAGVLDEHDARGALEGAGLAAGLSEREVERTVSSGLSAGISEPRALPEPKAREVSPKAVALAEGAVAASEAADWRASLIWKKDKEGNDLIKVSCLSNAITLLTHAEEWDGVIAWDAFRDRIVTMREPPWHPHDKPGDDWMPWQAWTDTDDTRAQSWLMRSHRIRVGRDVVASAVDSAARVQVRHPIREYLCGLDWDGVPRLDRWLPTYLESDDTPYTSRAGKWWLVSAVARVMEPGCQADHVLILEGLQGAGKSTGFQALFGDDWFADRLPDLGSKDAVLHLHGSWCIELSELEQLSRAESARAKAFFTTRIDRVRRPYERRSVLVPRQCVFVGSTNDSDYLKDPTGDRRYLPVRCGKVDVDALRRDRDQLWAEAIHAYTGGARWWPDGEDEVQANQAEQEKRYKLDEWEQTLAHWLVDRTAHEHTIREILEGCFDVEIAKQDQVSQNRVVRALKRLGYERVVVRRGEKTTKVYRPVGAHIPTDES